MITQTWDLQPDSCSANVSGYNYLVCSTLCGRMCMLDMYHFPYNVKYKPAVSQRPSAEPGYAFYGRSRIAG